MDFSEYDYELQPLTAGLAGRFWGWWKNYTSAERRANAALQLRDRFGRFAEMGRDHKFKFRNSGGGIENGTGKYIGPASREGYGRFYVKDHPALGTGVVEISNKNFREILTSLSEDYLRSRGINLGQDTTGNIVGARKDTDIPNIDDLNIKPATDEDLEAASDQTEDIPDLNEVIKTAEEGAIKYGDLKPGVIVRDEAGNRLGIVTQVDFVNGKVVPVIRWQDGERGRGTESDPEDLVTIWIPSEDADSPEGNQEKASVKARLRKVGTEAEPSPATKTSPSIGDISFFDVTDSDMKNAASEKPRAERSSTYIDGVDVVNQIMNEAAQIAYELGRFPVPRPGDSTQGEENKKDSDFRAAIKRQYGRVFEALKKSNPEFMSKYDNFDAFWGDILKNRVTNRSRFRNEGENEFRQTVNTAYAKEILGLDEDGFIELYRNSKVGGAEGRFSEKDAAAGYASLDRNMAWDYEPQESYGQYAGRYSIRVTPKEFPGIIGYSSFEDEIGAVPGPNITYLEGRVTRHGGLEALPTPFNWNGSRGMGQGPYRDFTGGFRFIKPAGEFDYKNFEDLLARAGGKEKVRARISELWPGTTFDKQEKDSFSVSVPEFEKYLKMLPDGKAIFTHLSLSSGRGGIEKRGDEVDNVLKAMSVIQDLSGEKIIEWRRGGNPFSGQKAYIPEAPAEKPVEKPAEKPVEDIADTQIRDLSGFKRVGYAMGSNEGGVYKDANGNEIYVKRPKTKLHGENEALAARLYELLGIDVAKVKFGRLADGTEVTYSEWIESELDLRDRLNDEEYLRNVQEGFGVDAWLANWDVAGSAYDNIVTDSSGKPVRIDTGGALWFRARGEAKGEAFGDKVGEIDSLVDGSNRQSRMLFGRMTEEQKRDSVAKLTTISPEEIRKVVSEIISDPNVAQKMSDTLIARRKDALDRFNISTPQFMAFDDEKTVSVADLKKGDSVVIGGETLKVKSKKDLKDGTFRIEFANEDGEVVEDLISEPTDTFDLPTPEEKEPAKGKGKKPATSPRKSVAYFFDDVDNLGQFKTLAKFGDVLALPDGKGGTFEAYYISHKRGTDAKGRSGYDVVLERASNHELFGAFIPSGYNTQQLVGPNGKTRVNRAKDVVAKKPTAPEKVDEGKKPAPSTPPLSADENAPTQKQIDSINRRLNEGRYPGIVSEARAKAINDLMPTLTKGNVGKIIKELNDAELKWRMDNGWSIDELIGKYYTDKNGNVTLPSKDVASRYESYKPYKDENGEPLPGVEQPAETEQQTEQDAVAETPDNPLPTSGEIGATGVLKGKVKFEIREDGDIYVFDDKSLKGEATFNHKETIKGVGFQKDGLGTVKIAPEKTPDGFAWKIHASVGQASADKLSIDDFRKEILQRLFNRINGIDDPNDVSQSVAEIPDGEISEDASDAIKGEPGETGSLGNGVGFSVSGNGSVVLHGDVQMGSENSQLIASVLNGDRDGYEVMFFRDGDENFEVEITPTDRSVPKTQHTKNLLNSLKKALSFATEEEPAEEETGTEAAEPRRLANNELADPTREERFKQVSEANDIEEISGNLGPKSMPIYFYLEGNKLTIETLGPDSLPEAPEDFDRKSDWEKFQHIVLTRAIRNAIAIFLGIPKEYLGKFIRIGEKSTTNQQLEVDFEVNREDDGPIPSNIDKANLLNAVSDAIANVTDNMREEVQGWITWADNKKAEEEAAKKKQAEEQAAEQAKSKNIWEAEHGSVLNPSQRTALLNQLKDAVANGIITNERDTEIKNQMRDGKFGTKDLELIQAELSGEKPAEEPEEDKPESSTELTLEDGKSARDAHGLVMESLPRKIQDRFFALHARFSGYSIADKNALESDENIFLEYISTVATEAVKLLVERYRRQSLSGDKDAKSKLQAAVEDLKLLIWTKYRSPLYTKRASELVDEDELKRSARVAWIALLTTLDIDDVLSEIDTTPETEEEQPTPEPEPEAEPTPEPEAEQPAAAPASEPFVPATTDVDAIRGLIESASQADRRNIVVPAVVGKSSGGSVDVNDFMFNNVTETVMADVRVTIFDAFGNNAAFVTAIGNAEATDDDVKLLTEQAKDILAEAISEANKVFNDLQSKSDTVIEPSGDLLIIVVNRVRQALSDKGIIEADGIDNMPKTQEELDAIRAPKPEESTEEAPAAEPETPSEEPAPTPTAEPEDEEEEPELTPDRELESVKASDIRVGDLLWDSVRGFSRVTSAPSQSESNPNNIVITHLRPGDPEPKRLNIRKTASVNVAKRDGSQQPSPQPTPDAKPQPTPGQKPQPRPDSKPKPKPKPEKKTGRTTRIYFMNPRGSGKPRLFTLDPWKNQADKDRVLEEARKMEAKRRADYDLRVENGLTTEPYRPMFLFEDGFEFSSEAASPKQLDSIVRRLSIPGLLSQKEIDKIAENLPKMSKKAIFDLITKLDTLEFQWRIDNGYPIDDLIKKRVPVGISKNKIDQYVPTKSMEDIPSGVAEPEQPPVSAMSFMDADTLASGLGVVLNPATMDAGERLPTPGAFTGALSDAVQGKNWAEVLDYLKNLETPIYYFDTETTGISDYDGDNQTNAALQVGIVKVVKGEVTERFNIYLNPEVPLGKWSSENLQRDTVTPQGEVIGSELVTDDWLSEQMDTAEAVRQMVDFMGTNPLIGGQNVPFDLEVLQRMLDKAGVTDFKVAGTVDSKDLIDVLIPKYDAEKGIDGPKKKNAEGGYDSTTSLGYVAKFLGFDTTRWHSADADAEDAFRLVMRSLEIGLDNPTKNIEALDAKSVAAKYKERMAKFLASVSSTSPATEKQNGGDSKGFREYLANAGLTIQEQDRVLAPVKRMTRGQAAAYISKFIEEHKKQGQQTLPLKLDLQEFIDYGEEASDLVLPGGTVLPRVSGAERRRLIRVGDTGKLAVDRNYAEQVAFESALGGPEEALKILSDPDSSRNAQKIERARALAAAKMARKPRDMVTLSVGDNNFLVYDALDGVEVAPEKLEKLAQLMEKAREIAPIGNRKLRVSLVTEEQMDLLNKQRPGSADRNIAFFLPDSDYMHIVLRKEDFYRRLSDTRMTDTGDQGLSLHNEGNIPASVRTFLHEYGHAYHYIMVKTNPIFGNEEFSPLAIEFKEKFGDTFITNYGEKSHHEKFAELFFDYAYSKLANRAPANPQFMDFIEGIIADKTNKPVGNASLLTSIILKRGASSKLGFASSGASIRGTNVDGITEITGKNLTELERSMEGYAGGNWLAGTDAGSGLIPPLSDASGVFNETYFKNTWLSRVVSDAAERAELTPEELDSYRLDFIEEVEQALNDTRTYRVFQVDGTNQFIRVKDALADPEQISDLVKNVQMMTKLNNLSNIPTYYTIFPSGTFTYEAYIANKLMGGITNAKAGEHGVFIGLNADVNFNDKGELLSPKVRGKNADMGGPDAKNRFNRTSIHEYGHGIASVYMGEESYPLYQEFQRRFGNTPMSRYGEENARENFAEYFYALYMWITEKGFVPDFLRDFADFFNENIVGKSPINRRPRELINVAEVAGNPVEPNFPSVKEEVDPLSEFAGRRRFYENGLTPVGTKLDAADAEFISGYYDTVLESEKRYLLLNSSPSVPENLKKLAKLQFLSQVGALKAAYDALVFSGNDKYDLAKEFPGEKPALMNFSEGWKDDQQGYPVIWDSYEDMPVTYADPLEKDVFDAEERSALKNYGNSGWRWISSLLKGEELSPTVSDMTESMLRGLANAFKKPEAKLTRDMYLYHGSAGYPGDGQHKDLIDAKPGDEITLPSYTSTSMSPNIAYEDFGPGSASLFNPEEGFFVIIRAPKGSNAIVMPEGLTYSNNEREVLLNSGAKLRVLEVSRSPRLDFEGYAVPGAYSTYIEADLVSTESMPARDFETPAGLTRDSVFEQDLDYLTAAFADSFNRDLSIYTNKDGGVGSSNSVVGYVTPAALSKMRGNVELDKDNVEKKIRSMSMGVLPTNPVVVAYNPETKSAFVLDGNHRVAAALESNVPFLPVMVVTTDAVGPESKKLDKGWAISPFGIDETGTSERWPDSFHPYFVFNDDDMLTPARNGGQPMFMQFEPSVWSSKIPSQIGEKSPNLVPESEPSDKDSQYDLEQLHPGSYVLNKKTGKIGVVYGPSYIPNPRDGSQILSGLIVKYLEGSEESYPSAFFTDDSFDEKGLRRVATGLTSVDGYSDVRYHTLRITNPSDLESVTDDFITPGTNGILLNETMFGVIKDTDKRGHIVGFPAKGAVTVAISDEDGSFSFENIPVSKFLPIQNERTAVVSGIPASQSKDMLPTIDDVDSIRTKLVDLYNWGFLSEKVYLAMVESVRGKFLTKSGVAELRSALNKADILRKAKREGGRVRKIAPAKERLTNLRPQQNVTAPAQMPQNVGDMTIDEFVKFLQGGPTEQTQFMQFEDGEENTSPTVETTVTTNPPTAGDIRTIQNIVQEAGVVPDIRAKQIWEMLPLLDAEQMSQLKARMLADLLDKRIRLNQPIAGIEIPEGYNTSKLMGYTPTVNLDGSPVQISTPGTGPREIPTDADLELSGEQKSVFNHVESTDTPIMITGKAGTGKSFLLKFISNYSSKRLAVVAPTGAAADNVGGSTIHSFFGIDPGIIYGATESSQLIKGTPKQKKKVEDRLKALEMLVVDEVSMVSADLLDAMDRILRRVHRKQFVPFGGVQVVMFGDVHQLPPVVERGSNLEKYMQETFRSPHFFDSRAWVTSPLEVYELSEVFRQTDPEFKKALNNIRVGRQTAEDISLINQAGLRPVPSSVKDLVFAVPRRGQAEEINDREMNNLGDVKSMSYAGEFNGLGKASFGRDLPSPENLFLKVGTRVMFTMNDTDKSAGKDVSDAESGQGAAKTRRWVNGTIGTVVDVLEDRVKVNVKGKVYDVMPATWERIGYDVTQNADPVSNQISNQLTPFTEATYKQIPLMPAWALTIHKLQGKTIDNMKLDLGRGTFAPGQLYTGLSRVRSLDGLYLERPISPVDVKVDPEALRFTESTVGIEGADSSQPSFMMFGGEPFDPADPDLDLDKELNYDFTSGPYGIPLLDYQEDMMKTYADMIAQAEEQFGSNSNKVKQLKSTRRAHYASYFARPDQREDNIMEQATENLDIDFEGSTTTERETPTVVESTTKINASYKDRYGRPYRLEAQVVRSENDYDPQQLDVNIEIHAYDPTNPDAGSVSSFATRTGGEMAGRLANEMFVDGIYTVEAYQRRHLATGLMAFARKLTDRKIYHSDKLTKMGHAFMESVEIDDRLKTIRYPSLAESQDEMDGAMIIDITKLSRTKSSSEITDLLQRLNADQIPYKLNY